MTDIQTWLDRGREIESKATDGPWGGTWNGAREGNIAGETDVLDATNVSAQDLSFIMDARTRLPQTLNALQAVLDLHKPYIFTWLENGRGSAEMHTRTCAWCENAYGPVEYPCPTVEAIQNAIGDPQ